MPDVMNYYLPCASIDFVNNSIVSTLSLNKSSAPSSLIVCRGNGSLPRLSTIFITRKTVDLESERRSFSTEGFGITLYEAIFFQTPFEFNQTDRLFFSTLRNNSQVVQVLKQLFVLL